MKYINDIEITYFMYYTNIIYVNRKKKQNKNYSGLIFLFQHFTET